MQFLFPEQGSPEHWGVQLWRSPNNARGSWVSLAPEGPNSIVGLLLEHHLGASLPQQKKKVISRLKDNNETYVCTACSWLVWFPSITGHPSIARYSPEGTSVVAKLAKNCGRGPPKKPPGGTPHMTQIHTHKTVINKRLLTTSFFC